MEEESLMFEGCCRRKTVRTRMEERFERCGWQEREVLDSMDRMDFWNVFERTGNVEDYLNYTACTGEEKLREACHEDGDRWYGGCTGERPWDRFVSDAGGGN